ncbi:Hypothetical protein, putative [Bodo saltans]|uniref:Uncharacterized protein n=1 Tax=Bodo saltans TaxID=75058 RepID=A0A0S4KKI5_BODSA|nr:Hypothetical protein, putative [Bodo saltans]|eukprot:CUI13126.1 Hypothetical protein, putative [Bodo saltans]
MTLAKIEIERILRDERAENERNAAALEAMCSRASSRAATPMPADDDADDDELAPTGGGPSRDAPRRASISMARRHQRRRSSIQALANTSYLAVDEETKALLSENNSMVGSRRGSRSPSPAPLLDEEEPPRVGLFTIRPSSSRPVSARLAQSLLVHVGPRTSSPMLSVVPQDDEPPPTFLASFTFGSANPVQPQTETKKKKKRRLPLLQQRSRKHLQY